jgi:hypothetical protein
MTDNTPLEFPQTPIPKFEFKYLPSPPITPICGRSIKRESTGTPISFDDIGEYTTSSDETVKLEGGRKPRGRPPKSSVGHPPKSTVRRSSKSTVGSPRSTGKKLSVRRKLSAVGKIPRRIGGAKPMIHPTIVKSRDTTKNSKFKFNDGSSDTTYEPFRPSPTIKKPAFPKCVKKSNVGGTRKVNKGRTTNNSLSTTIHPTITKRKYQRRNLSNTGKICSSYYPSSQKVRPNVPGDRYFKGIPYSLLLWC